MSRLVNISRLTLGTAQLGMPYGIVNTTGDIGTEGAAELLDFAWQAGITCFDTARVYGQSETRIGAWMAARKSDPVIVSKIPALTGSDDGIDLVQNFSRSTDALGVAKIDGLLCHRAEDLMRSEIRTGLEGLVASGKIEQFGASIYAPDDLFKILEIDTVGMVQVPLSLANPGFFDQGAIGAAAARGVLVFARSVYLQGLLLTPPDRLPSQFGPLAGPIRKLHGLARENSCNIATLALAAVNAVPGIHSIVIGAESKSQIEGTLAAFNTTLPKPSALEEAWTLFKNVPPELVDPNRWPRR